jgi:hypothetical protein
MGEKIVTGCVDCPFANWDYEVCNHPYKTRRIDLDTITTAYPVDCPLKTEPITISIKK